MSTDQQEPTPEPWSYVEPLTSEGDADYNDTLRGVGLVLHEWTLVEIALSHLQAILGGSPRDGASIQAYGMGRVFSARLEGFKQVAYTYFVRNCDQHREAELDGLVLQVSGFSTRRNEVAHGVLRNFHMLDLKTGGRTQKLSHFLVCPYYDQRGKSLFDFPFYMYNSATLNNLAINISRLQVDIEIFSDLITPDEALLVDRRPLIGRLPMTGGKS